MLLEQSIKSLALKIVNCIMILLEKSYKVKRFVIILKYWKFSMIGGWVGGWVDVCDG